MGQHDDADLAAIRVLERMVEREAIEFVSSRGISKLASRTASFLLRCEPGPARGAAFAAWLMDDVEVRDIYVGDEQLEALLRELWDPSGDRGVQAVEARRADLEALLRSAPDNFDHRLVYGDWLQTQQDPLGELITRQLAAASEPDHRALEQAAASYLREHAFALFGPLAEYLDSVVRLTWRGGFIEKATLGRPRDDIEPYEGAILLRWLLDHRTAMLLRELELQPFNHYWDPEQVRLQTAQRGWDQLRAQLAVLLERPRPLLRRLTVGIDGNSGEAGELARLDKLLPDLEILELRVRSAAIERLRHAKLRRLVWSNEIGPNQAKALVVSKLPRLEHLALGRLSTYGDLGSILAGLRLPSLRSLQVPGPADNLDWLVRVPWRAQLEHLDLSGGNLRDGDAWLLATQRWPRLRHLDVSNNQLGPDAIARLAMLAPTVVMGEQRPA